jgi:hypothetical protein
LTQVETDSGAVLKKLIEIYVRLLNKENLNTEEINKEQTISNYNNKSDLLNIIKKLILTINIVFLYSLLNLKIFDILLNYLTNSVINILILFNKNQHCINNSII